MVTKSSILKVLVLPKSATFLLIALFSLQSLPVAAACPPGLIICPPGLVICPPGL